MKQRAAEVLFRHKLLLLLPLAVILPLSVVAALAPQAEKWQSFAVIWVDTSAAPSRDERLGFTPAINQAQLLTDFLHTRSFALTVLGQTKLADELTTPAGELEAIQLLWRSVGAFPNSNNFVTVVASTTDPELSLEVAAAVVREFETALRGQAEAKLAAAIELHTGALTRGEQSLNKSRAELAAYLQARPDLARSGNDPLSTAATAQDPTLARLQAQVNYESQQYTAARDRLSDAQLVAAAGLTGQQFTFTVIDEPQEAVAPISASRIARLKLPIAGVVVAMILSAGIAAFLIVTNRGAFSATDLNGTGMVFLAEIPELRRGSLLRRGTRDAVRQRLTAPARSTNSAA